MRVHRWWSIVAIIPGAVFAADPPPEGVWTGKGQAGYVASQGNTEAESANAALDMTLISNKWKHLFHLGGLYGKSAGILSAERWDSGWQSDYNFSADMFSFGALRYAHDMFSGFQYQAALTVGMGYKFINTPTTQFSGQLGVGYRKSRPELIVKNTAGAVLYRIPQDITNDAIITAEVDYAQQLTASTSLSNKLLVESGSSNTLITDSFALAVKMSDRLALSVGINVQDNTKPPVGLKQVDTTETVNLVYAF
jgi:putative salt-induced outer membrane protein